MSKNIMKIGLWCNNKKTDSNKHLLLSHPFDFYINKIAQFTKHNWEDI